MATAYPTSIDPGSGTGQDAYVSTATLYVQSHAAGHNWLRDAVLALEAKVGANGSAVATSLDYRVTTAETAITTNAAAAVQKSTVTTKGDLILGTGAATVARQAVGTDNQMLIADSTQTNGVRWANSAINLLAAKGSLLGATAANTPAAVTVGTNNQILTADSTQATGVKWADGPAALLTAKGSLLTASAANTPANLAVGTNGYLLLADSNQTTGLRYSGPAAEAINIVASAATGTINMNLDTAPIWYYTTNATANHTLNVRYSATVSLATFMSVGSSVTCVWLNTNGTTAYWPSTFQIDGSTVTPKWQGGTAPTGGNASAVDVYTYTIIKTAATPTYTVLASQVKFA